MKRIYLIIVLLLPLVFSGCSDDDHEARRVLYPITPDATISDFFEEHLSYPLYNKSTCFLEGLEEDRCFVINSLSELKEVWSCSELPDIDFENYSLIIGKKELDASYYTRVQEQIIETETLIKLNIKLYLGDSYLLAFSTLYHWSVYPKVDNKKELVVNYIYE